MPITLRRTVLPILLANLFSPMVFADALDTVTYSIGLGALHDNNLFRQSGGNEKSDTIRTTSMSLGFNKAWSLQQIRASATLIDYNYQQNDYLSYRAKNYDAAWNWSFTPHLTGTLGLDRTEQQNSFVDYSTTNPGLRRNVRRTENQRYTLDWEVASGWHAQGGVSRISVTNSQTYLEQNSYNLNNVEFGGRYVWTSGTYLQLFQRSGKGEYQERKLIGFDQVPAPYNSQFDTGFHQNETELKFHLPLTGKSTVNARLARQERRHDHFSDRDYAANVGRVEYNWQPTAKLSLNTLLRRDVASYQSYSSSYYIADGITLQPAWQITVRTAMRFRYDWEKRHYEGGIYPGLAEREDKLKSARLSLEWTPADWSMLSVSAQQDRRDSNITGSDFKSNQLGLNAQFLF